MSSAVLDSGPLVHLSELNALDALNGFESLYVPSAVWKEVSQIRPDALTNQSLRLQRVDTPTLDMRLVALAQSLSLDAGELHALAVMSDHPTAIFLTDDAAARLAAEEMGYTVHGTIGLLIRSARKKYRTREEVLQMLRALNQNSTLYIRLSLLQDVIRRVEEEWFPR